jgi:hypothetical protein
MNEMEVQIYNVEGLGPVVQLSAVKHLVRYAPTMGFAQSKLSRLVRTLGELESIGANATPVRLAPAVPDVGVAPFIATVEVTE